MKKYILLTLLLTLSIASTVKVDAISIFGKELNFGKIFNKAKPATPISAVVDSRVKFEVTFPKKDTKLTAGDKVNITWKGSTNPKSGEYSLQLSGENKKITETIGKVKDLKGSYSWTIPKNLATGKYKINFLTGGSIAGGSPVFEVIAPNIIPSKTKYKFTSGFDAVVPGSPYVSVKYIVYILSKGSDYVDQGKNVEIKITCPNGVSTKFTSEDIERCNTKTLLGSMTGPLDIDVPSYSANLKFTNINNIPKVVTAEAFIGEKSLGKVVNNIKPTPKTPTVAFAVTFPTSDSVLTAGETYKVTWTGDKGDLSASTAYSVILVSGNTGEEVTVAKVYGSDKSFTWTVKENMHPGKYKLVFSGKAAGGSSSFFTVVGKKDMNPTIQAISSTATVIKDSNIDKAINVNMRFNFTANGSDVYAANNTDVTRNMTAIIGLRDMSNGNIITTSKPLNVTTSEYLTTFPEGSTKQAEFSHVFTTSTLSTGSTNVQAFLQSVTYTPTNSNTSKTVTTALGVFNTNVVSVNVGGSTTIFTRDLTLGSIGDDVVRLKQYLVSNGFMDASNIATSTNYFGNETLIAVKKFQLTNGISPADGYVGPMTRIVLNSKTIIIKEN